MIVRISNEGQYEVPDDDIDGAQRARQRGRRRVRGDRRGGRSARRSEPLLDFVRSQGTPSADDELVGSDMILPPPDVSLEEARTEFQGEGLIPG